MAGSRGGQCPSLADYVRGRRAIWEATPAACPGAVLAGRTLASVGEQLGNLEDLARVAHARDTPRLMAQLLATAAANRQSNGILLSARELESFDRAVASARGALDDATFRSAWATGAGSPVEDVLRLADTA